MTAKGQAWGGVMWEKTDIYPYHRKNLDIVKEEKSQLSKLFNWENIKLKMTNLKLNKETVSLMLIGFLFARALVLGELLPFGMAFLAALTVSKKNSLPILLAVMAGTVTTVDQLVLYLNVAALSVLMVVLHFYEQILERHWFIPAATVFAVNFAVKAVGYLFFTPGLYYWTLALIESLLAGGITVLLTLIMVHVVEKGLAWDKPAPEEMAALMVVCLGVIMGLADLVVLGVSIKAVVSKLAILVSALAYGPGVAAIIGAMVGVIPSANNMMTPAFAGILAFSGVLAGVFGQFRKLGVIIGFILGNLVFTVYLADETAILYYIGETLIASVILLILPINLIERLASSESRLSFGLINKENDSSSAYCREQVKELSQIIREIGRTFEETVEEVSTEEGTELIVENVKNRLCQDCLNYQSCWATKSYQTTQVIYQLVEQLKSNGRLNQRDVPIDFLKKCRLPNELVVTLACSYDTWQVNRFWQQKILENNQVIPSQLKGLSAIMENLAERINGKSNQHHQWQVELEKNLKQKGIQCKKVQFIEDSIEDSEILISQNNCGGKLDCSEVAVSEAIKLLDKQFKVKKINCNFHKDSGICTYQLKPALQFKITVGTAQMTKTGSPISGDTYSLMPLNHGKFGLVLSDGMGTGQKAKLESNTTVELLENLLEAGFDRETAVKTVNAILVLRNREDTFATLDMAIIDLYTGELEHTKIGAVPSFLKRGSQVGIVKANSLPIGILNHVETATIKEQLQVGDMIVLVSDGVLEAETQLLHKEKWVQELLGKLTTDDPQEIAEQILFQARILSVDKNKDDMTVLVGRVDSRLH